ncbi:MAG: S9 family peptidase [Deltaproteobacteria bacterium]|nr:S9 family peptidase [Deltaproteobacteria bacterium]
MDPVRAALSELNRTARAGAVSETMFGVVVADPYRSLESDTPATKAWIDAQNDRTARALARLADPARLQRLERLLSIGVITRPAIGGTSVFFLRREGEREQPALYVSQRGRVRAEPVVDPVTVGPRVALDWYEPSPSGRLVAYGLSDNGDERSTLKIAEVSTGRILPDTIPRTKWSRISWLNDERGFYYTRYPAPGEPAYDPDHEDTYFPRLFFHALGTDPAADPLIFGGERGTDFPGAEVSPDDRWVAINVFRGWSASDVYLLDRRATGSAATPRPVVVGTDDLTTGRVHRGRLWLHTNVGAPRYRIATADPRTAAGPETWTDVVAEGPATIDAFTLSANRIVVHTIDDVRSRLHVYRPDGRLEREIELPTRGSVDGLAASPRADRVAFAWSSFFFPPALYSFDLRAARLDKLAEVSSDFDVSGFELEQARVPSADGTPINVYLVHRRGMARDGQNPVLVNGYGGFNISLLPTFARTALFWLEQGGVWAVANLRGGGEGGEAWHRAGNLENKPRVFEDFEAVLRWLSSSGISSPDRIAITGGSNGGLLMGAMITRAPEAFRAATTYVGLYDMLRYDRFPPAELWVTEYGTAQNEAQFRVLYGYSPYHRVRDGVRYPAVLVETADHDSRVYWGHSTKFAARLQEAQAGDLPIYFHMERQVGHGAGTRLTDLVRRFDRAYAFLEDQLGMRR